MSINHFKIMLAAVVIIFFTGSVGVFAEAPGARQVSGEIISVDLKQGMLKVQGGVSENIDNIIEYQLNQNAVLIMNTSDKKLLTIDDLRPGQYVAIDSIQRNQGHIAQKIVIGTRPVNMSQNKKEKFEQGSKDFHSKENKKFRLKMLAEEQAAKSLKEKQENEDAQDKGEGPFKVRF